MRCISIVRSLYFRIFSASFLLTFLSPEIAASFNIHVPFLFYYYYYYYYYYYCTAPLRVVLNTVPHPNNYSCYWKVFIVLALVSSNRVRFVAFALAFGSVLRHQETGIIRIKTCRSQSPNAQFFVYEHFGY